MVEKNWHNLEIEEVVGILKTDIVEGLREKEVKERQKAGQKDLFAKKI